VVAMLGDKGAAKRSRCRCAICSKGRPLSTQRNYPVILIEWVDASRLADSWIDLSDVPEPYPHKCVSVGFLISENENGKIIIPTIADIEHPENRHTYGGMLIPRSAIISEYRVDGLSEKIPIVLSDA
jgi:hypothetical protein